MKIIDYIESNKSVINTLMKIGLLPCEIANKLERYKFYKDARKLGQKKSYSINLTMLYFKCSKKTVYNSINLFEATM